MDWTFQNRGERIRAGGCVTCECNVTPDPCAISLNGYKCLPPVGGAPLNCPPLPPSLRGCGEREHSGGGPGPLGTRSSLLFPREPKFSSLLAPCLTSGLDPSVMLFWLRLGNLGLQRSRPEWSDRRNRAVAAVGGRSWPWLPHTPGCRRELGGVTGDVLVERPTAVCSKDSTCC